MAYSEVEKQKMTPSFKKNIELLQFNFSKLEI